MPVLKMYFSPLFAFVNDFYSCGCLSTHLFLRHLPLDQVWSQEYKENSYHCKGPRDPDRSLVSQIEHELLCS